jgi:hypothetical protein
MTTDCNQDNQECDVDFLTEPATRTLGGQGTSVYDFCRFRSQKGNSH